MSFRRYGLPIFLLYIVTSLIFLTLFTKNSYDANYRTIIENHMRKAGNVANELRFLHRHSLDFNDYETGDEGVKINITNLLDGAIYREEFRTDGLKFENLGDSFADGQKRGKFKDKALQANENEMHPPIPQISTNTESFYLKESIGRHGMSEFEIIIKTSEFGKNLLALKAKTLLNFVIVLAFYLFIAYFIIKLSFRPLLEKINDMDSFIKDTTHEINTPLSVILMSIEMFKTNPEKYLQNIKTAAKKLSNLQHDLVELNLKSEPNSFSDVDLKALVSERVNYFTPLLEQKNLKFDCTLGKCQKTTDQNKLTNILDNLIQNAVKYSNSESVISVNLDEKQFKISNIGEAISDENRQKIFEKFARFSKTQSGFGIGLSLVKKYCDELGFKIICQNLGEKTTFIINF